MAPSGRGKGLQGQSFPLYEVVLGARHCILDKGYLILVPRVRFSFGQHPGYSQK